MNINSHICGLLLGDGHLEMHKNGKNASLKITRALKDKEYLIYTAKMLNNFNTEKAIKEGSIYDERTQKEYFNIKYRSKCDPFFTEYHKKWYLNKKKIVPKDIILDPEMLATWFADDGSIAIRKSVYEVKLSTHSFSDDEIFFLMEQLYNLGIKSNIHHDNGHGIIKVYKKSEVKNFIDIIKKPFSLLSMNRKAIWENNEVYKLLIPRDVVPCKWCNSIKTYRNGHNDGNQKYYCNQCFRQFYFNG